MSALKPCPFCEGEGSLERVTWGRPYVACAGCGASAWGDTPQSAIAAWNRRAGDDEVEKLRARVERLEALLRQAMDSRAPDLADAEHPGWSDRARTALGDTP